MAAKLSDWLEKLRGNTKVEDISDLEGRDLEEDSDSTESTVDSEDLRRQKELLSRQEDANRGKNINPEGDIFIDELWFCSIAAGICTLNLLLLGLETDYACRGHGCKPKDQELWRAFHLTFTGLFVTELIIRMRASGLRRYFQGVIGREGSVHICGSVVRLKLSVVNCLDFLIISLGTIDILFIAPSHNSKPSLYLLSVFRIHHLAPCAKHLQLNKAFRELWLVISALGETMRTLGWVCLMLVFVTWVAAILVTMALLDTSALSIKLDRAQWTFDDYWGSVSKTTDSLLQFMTRDKWGDSLVFPLVERNKSLITIFLIFYIIAGMALMNAIVAVVIESTLATGKLNQDEAQKQVEDFEKTLLASLQSIFHDADVDGNGEMSREELHQILRKPNVRDRLRILLIPRVDLEMLFELLDTAEMDQVGNKGQVNCDKFFRGVSKLRGPARAADLHQMSIDLSRAYASCSDMMDGVDNANSVLANVLDNMSVADIEIVRGERDTKDPVLLARRARGLKRISEDIRRPDKDPIPIVKRHNPWDQFSDSCGRARLPSKGSNAKRSSKGSNVELDRATLDAPPLRSSLLVDAPGGTAKKQTSKKPPAPDPNQPPPPPLPEHLRYLKESEAKARQLNKPRKVLDRRARRPRHSDDDD
eukprot:TRINITY_DN27795_c0_g1_i1.p1 TRINITY_DN27795_c0_g1~~TRINITY_DN27795_c0_g1_i1.p1  ORF type:complete len:671 (+),score=91.27 TRINITY_DN27795_c0_g1_i1:72-2015(+)